MTRLSEKLRRAARRIERGWCQGANARDRNDVTVGALDPRAVCWCAAGALSAESVETGGWLPERYWWLRWNDAPGTVASEMAMALYLAAEIAEEEGR